MAARCSERAAGPGADTAGRLGRRVRALLMAAVLCAGAPSGPRADDEAEAAAEFAGRRQELQAEMDRLRARMRRFEEQELSLLGRVERLRLEAQLREQELSASELERRRLERTVDRLRFQIERLSERLVRRREALGARLRAAYRHGPMVPARALQSGAAGADWVRALGLLEHQARRDARDIGGLRTDAAELERSLEAQRRALSEREQEVRRVEEHRSALALAIREHQNLLDAVRGDRETHRAAYEELLGAARELDALIGRVESGEGSEAQEAAWASLGPFRGLLDKPVAGRLRVPFGDIRHPRFGTLTPHRGLTFEAPPTASVRAVFEGEVVFQDWLRGYGQTVILDHHHGYLSVYAHLSEAEVRMGQRVSRGGTIGQVGESGSLEGPQLYFELRRDGLPLDPEPWLAGGGRVQASRGGRR